MSRANLAVFEADLSASLANLQRILNFYSLRNLASNELFLLIFYYDSFIISSKAVPLDALSKITFSILMFLKLSTIPFFVG